MNKVVFIEGNKAVTSSRIIAEGCQIKHQAALQLVKKYKLDLEDVGETSAFEMRKFKTTGRQGEEAILDEPQTTFLITLMKNSKSVVKFKKKLTKEFFRQRKIISSLISQRENTDWQNVRSDGKLIYRQKTDIIKKFVDYCKANGSKSAGRYYGNLAKMENSALFFLEQKFKNVREILTIKQLMQVATADDVIEKALVEGMEQGLDYHDCFSLAKERVIAFSNIIGKSPVLSLEIKSE